MTSYFINHTLCQIRQTISYAKEEITNALKTSMKQNEGWSYSHDIELFEMEIDANNYIVNLVLNSGYDCPDYPMFVNELDVSDLM